MHKTPIIELGEVRRAQSNLRIQKFDDIVKMGGFDVKGVHNESIIYTRRVIRILKKKIGRTTLASGLIAKHWQRDPNKGYPKNFKDYLTYDPRHN